MIDPSHFAKARDRITGMVAAVQHNTAFECVGYGILSSNPTPEHLVWEVGSITKVFTGILLAEMSLRGEVGLDDPIGRHVPPEVADRLPANQPTLRQLATHTSGLPRVPKAWLRRLKGQNDPYSWLSETDVWAVLGPNTQAPRRPRFAYSNLGMGLLGHLLARTAATTYPELVMSRIIRPLGLESTSVGGGSPVPGFRRRKPTPPWTFGALAGAGAIRSTASDLLTFSRSVMEPPPGVLGDALRLATEVAHRGRILRMGLGWMHRIDQRHPERRVVWHNGGTYGTASFLAIDLERRVAAVAFGNRGPRLTTPLDRVGWSVFDDIV